MTCNHDLEIKFLKKSYFGFLGSLKKTIPRLIIIASIRLPELLSHQMEF